MIEEYIYMKTDALLPYDFKTIEDKKIYKFLQDPISLLAPHRWIDYHLLGEGHYTQIYGTEKWQMLLPHSRDRKLLDENHIINIEDKKIDFISMASDDNTIPDTHKDH